MKHKETLSHSLEKLSGPEVIKKRIRSPSRSVRGQPGQGLTKGGLIREIEAAKLWARSADKEFLLAFLRIGCLIYLYTKRTPSGGSRVSSNGIHQPRCDICNKIK